MQETRLLPLLTVRRISRLTGQPEPAIRRLLDEHPEIQPMAVADDLQVFDRDTFLRLSSLIQKMGGTA